MSAIEYDFAGVRSTDTVYTETTSEGERRLERAYANLRAIVQVRESPEKAWKEVTKVTTVSRNGLGVTLTRPCTVGRLVNLILPMPPEYRAYDLDAELYEVVGIVQYCNPSTINTERLYHAGLGLIGKDVPRSFVANPKQNYRISGMTPDGLWAVTEAASQFKHRKNPRYWITLPVLIALIHRKDEPVRQDQTFTKNVSLSGMSLSTTLKPRAGDKVRVSCPAINFHSIAVVRDIQAQVGRNSTIHLEFDGQSFPIDKVTPASRKS